MQRVQKKTKNIRDLLIFLQKMVLSYKKESDSSLAAYYKYGRELFFYEKSLGTDAFLLWAWNGSAFLCSGDYIYVFLCDRMPDPWI